MSNHGKMPDVVLHYPERHWLLPVESVTSHGPVDGKRHAELARLFDLFHFPMSPTHPQAIGRTIRDMGQAKAARFGGALLAVSRCAPQPGIG
jgi:BsuBI/PstI restriction endonuclease domain